MLRLRAIFLWFKMMLVKFKFISLYIGELKEKKKIFIWHFIFRSSQNQNIKFTLI